MVSYLFLYLFSDMEDYALTQSSRSVVCRFFLYSVRAGGIPLVGTKLKSEFNEVAQVGSWYLDCG